MMPNTPPPSPAHSKPQVKHPAPALMDRNASTSSAASAPYQNSSLEGNDRAEKHAAQIQRLSALIDKTDPRKPEYEALIKQFEALLDVAEPMDGDDRRSINPFPPISPSLQLKTMPEKEKQAEMGLPKTSASSSNTSLGVEKQSRVNALRKEYFQLVDSMDIERLSAIAIELEALGAPLSTEPYVPEPNQYNEMSKDFFSRQYDSKLPRSDRLAHTAAPPTSPAGNSSWQPPSLLDFALFKPINTEEEDSEQLLAINAARFLFSNTDDSQPFTGRMEQEIKIAFINWMQSETQLLALSKVFVKNAHLQDHIAKRSTQQYLNMSILEGFMKLVNASIQQDIQNDIPEVVTISELVMRPELSPYLEETINAINEASATFTQELQEGQKEYAAWPRISKMIEEWFAKILCLREACLSDTAPEVAKSLTSFQLAFVTSFKKECIDAIKAIEILARIHQDNWEQDEKFQTLLYNMVQSLTITLQILSTFKKMDTDEPLASLQALMTLIIHHPDVEKPFDGVNEILELLDVQSKKEVLAYLKVKSTLLACFQETLNHGLWTVETIYNDERFLAARRLFSEESRRAMENRIQEVENYTWRLVDDVPLEQSPSQLPSTAPTPVDRVPSPNNNPASFFKPEDEATEKPKAPAPKREKTHSPS